jgi:predicted N-acyltransferase
MDVRWVDTLSDVDAMRWDEVAAGLGLYYSHRWLLAMEGDPGVRTRYVLVERGGRLLAALPVYEVADEGSEFYLPARHHGQLTGGGDWLLAGTRRAYQSGIAVCPDLDRDQRDRGTRAALDAAREHAAARGFRGVVWMYATTGSARLLRRHGCAVALDTAEATIPVAEGGLDDYLDRMPARARRSFRREMRAFSAAGYRVQRQSLAECWPELVPLLGNIQAKYGHVVDADRLARRLRQQAENLGELSTVFRADDGAAPRGFALAYTWGDTCYLRMTGFDYANLRGAFEYFNLVYYLPITFAGERGLTAVHLGPESLDVKVRRGALLHPLWTVALPCDRTATLEPGPKASDPTAWLTSWPQRALVQDEWLWHR